MCYYWIYAHMYIHCFLVLKIVSQSHISIIVFKHQKNSSNYTTIVGYNNNKPIIIIAVIASSFSIVSLFILVRLQLDLKWPLDSFTTYNIQVNKMVKPYDQNTWKYFYIINLYQYSNKLHVVIGFIKDFYPVADSKRGGSLFIL